MATEEFSNVFFQQPAFALVIGISKYEQGVDLPEEGDVQLRPEQFPNLKLAAKDARDFADFLKKNGFLPPNVRSLIDGEANLDSIKTEFNDLKERCIASGDEDPLVIIYFAGHGWVHGDEHYLVPWDAQRDKLYKPGLSNEEFSTLLGRLPTKKLAVFIDACHAGA